VKKLFWFVVVVVLLFLFVNWLGSKFNMYESEDEIDLKAGNLAVIEVNGVIMESLPVIEQIQKIRESDQIKAVLVRIDSPGGAVGASQEIFMELKKLGAKLPLAVSMGNLAASGGLYVSLAGEKVFALPGTITGSMGVLMNVTNISRLMQKIYLDPITIRSGELKDAGNPTKPMDEKSRKFIQAMVDQNFAQFREDVKRERKLSDETITRLSDGRVVMGTEAVKIGLAQQIGTFQDAVDYLAEKAKLTKPKLTYVSRKPLSFVERLFEGSLARVGNWLVKTGGTFYLMEQGWVHD